MKFLYMLTCALLFSGLAGAQTFSCDLRDYHGVDGLRAEVGGNGVELNWEGEAGQQLRAQFTLRDGQPVVQELAARKSGGEWRALGKDLTPDFEVTTGRRRISSTEMDILKQQHKDTPEQMRNTSGPCSGMRPWPFREATHLAGPPRTARRNCARQRQATNPIPAR